ncbi:MAG: propionyl-CoA carboxylase [Planctomycetota bacterium]|nr:MAG: propionyl-CoA carboxylase [Planctomycetota bacterium]
MAHVPLSPIGRPRGAFLSDEDYRDNLAAMRAREKVLAERRAEVAAGWGEKYVARVHEKGKLTARERIERLADAGAGFLPLGTFVNYGEVFGGKLKSPGAGVITGFTRVAGRRVLVIANDNTVASGSWWPRTPEKIQRAQDVALRLNVPVIYLVDCSGLFLPEQSRTFSGARGAGHIFERNAQLSAAGVPQIAGVFGDCIAGGGYMPIISDRVIMTEQAYMVIAGAALIKGAKSQQITSLDIGGPEVHVHQSGCADVRVPDDEAALAWIRREVERLPAPACDYYRAGAEPAPPRFDPAELAGIVPVDHRVAYEVREVLARLVDASLFWELWPHIGREVVVGVGRVSGLYVGFACNDPGLVPDAERPGKKRPGGILYREGIAKLAQFARACDADGIPLVWLQDVSGFDIGAEAERLGLLGWGSSLIYANSTQRAPVFTVLLRRASGAGYYAMSGRPYDCVVQLSTPVSRLSVMEGRTLAIATYRTKLDEDFRIKTEDPEERARIEAGMKEVEARIESDMDPYVAARQLDTDEIVALGELRETLEGFVELAYQATGRRTIKNPRIWSLHDLAALAPARGEPWTCLARREKGRVRLAAPAVGVLRELAPVGAALAPGQVAGEFERLGVRCALVVPPGASGVVRERRVEVPTPLGYGDAFLELVPIGELADAGEEEHAGGGAAGELVLRAPQVGRFYHRPSPDRDPYVQAGDVLESGKTVGLIEVMKTFFQVHYGDPGTGVGLPARARVVAHLVADGDEVAQDQPLLALEAIEP